MSIENSKVEETYIIKNNEEDEYYLAIERHIGITEYMVEDNIYEHPNCSWIKLKMYNNMDEEVGSISLDNADSVYLARKILESLTFI